MRLVVGHSHTCLCQQCAIAMKVFDVVVVAFNVALKA